MIILAGGGDEKKSFAIDEYYCNHIDKSGTTLYIPIALYNNVPFNRCLEWFHSTYDKLGLQHIKMVTDLNDIQNVDDVTSIYIGGGNTFYLLDQIRKSNFDVKIKKVLQNGGIVYGGSAGAIVLGKSIETCSHMDENVVGLDNLEGLNLLNDYSVFCHYKDNEKNRVEELNQKLNNRLIVLREEEGLVIHNDNTNTKIMVKI